METIVLPHEEKKASFWERKLTRKGSVLAVRSWQPDHFLEIDVHLPGLNMHSWKDAQHIKCRVGSFAYRDYTPAGWDAGTSTCTLFIDAGHNGVGSAWARSLQAGDTLYYLGAGSSHQQPAANKRHVFVGDQSAIGHFAALQQLAGPQAAIEGAVVLEHEAYGEQLKAFLPRLTVQPLQKSDGSLENWLQAFPYHEQSVFYLVGNTAMVVALRKILKQQGYKGPQIKVQGFWR
jgi:NADPH-dependent ferric siderophore reductase